MTDNPIEVQEARETVIRAFEKCLLELDENATEDYCGVALDAYRTAILKHDPDVRALADILERLAEDERPCDEISVHFDDKTYCLTHGGQWPCMWQAAKEALEAYRTAVSGKHGEG